MFRFQLVPFLTVPFSAFFGKVGSGNHTLSSPLMVHNELRQIISGLMWRHWRRYKGTILSSYPWVKTTVRVISPRLRPLTGDVVSWASSMRRRRIPWWEFCVRRIRKASHFFIYCWAGCGQRLLHLGIVIPSAWTRELCSVLLRRSVRYPYACRAERLSSAARQLRFKCVMSRHWLPCPHTEPFPAHTHLRQRTYPRCLWPRIFRYSPVCHTTAFPPYRA